ncbi:MAG TPA: 2,3-bisphosphoglycerate-independent phosphoglycerate mutase, partial [Acholeplasmataceae bacterium]|nr:2,3-bisphosphoglycerate-independent phosphoglycerate mutase [Acholeplasmataceae bacterium]
MKKTVALIILDGYGLSDDITGNAVKQAKTPFLDTLFTTYPHNTLKTSGEAVGLPEGQMGNSEVGHLNLGAGRIVYQSLTRINKSIRDGDFYTNQAFLDAIAYAKNNQGRVHVFGLVSDGGVHAYPTHIKALFSFKDTHDVPMYLHAFMDGRDTPPHGGKDYLRDLIDQGIQVATVSGRYYAMDRDNNWSRIQASIDAMTIAKGTVYHDPLEGIQASYEQGITDEFIVPFVSNIEGQIKEGDAIIFANFRPDRAIRIATAFSNPSAASHYVSQGKPTLDASHIPNHLFFVSMMHYADTVKGSIAFPLQSLEDIYGEVIERHGMTQLRLAETEKYPHVTFFFDGGKEQSFSGSTRVLIQSPKVATYDLKPEMSAYEVKDKAVEAIASGTFNTMILNFANPDMVGHTGSLEATIKAVEAVDACTKAVVEALQKHQGIAIVLADHGNAE